MTRDKEKNIVKIEDIKEAKQVASISKKINNIDLSLSDLIQDIKNRPTQEANDQKKGQ
jgi:hypothetical protein